MLKVAIDRAKAGNMPSDKIQRAVDRGMGIRDSNEIVYENTYEFYGPESSAFIIDCETDNPSRTITELRTLMMKNGGKMASEGSISWQFEEIGFIKVKASKSQISEDELEELLLQILEIDGINDIKKSEESGFYYIKIHTDRSNLKAAVDKLKSLNRLELEEAGLKKISNSLVEIKDEEKMHEFEELFEEVSGVVNIWKNFEYNGE
jgi:transcriptional/translational regulatory protein YebC/TACO1